jgi:hypothetical protein
MSAGKVVSGAVINWGGRGGLQAPNNLRKPSVLPSCCRPMRGACETTKPRFAIRLVFEATAIRSRPLLQPRAFHLALQTAALTSRPKWCRLASLNGRAQKDHGQAQQQRRTNRLGQRIAKGGVCRCWPIW